MEIKPLRIDICFIQIKRLWIELFIESIDSSYILILLEYHPEYRIGIFLS